MLSLLIFLGDRPFRSAGVCGCLPFKRAALTNRYIGGGAIVLGGGWLFTGLKEGRAPELCGWGAGGAGAGVGCEVEGDGDGISRTGGTGYRRLSPYTCRCGSDSSEDIQQARPERSWDVHVANEESSRAETTAVKKPARLYDSASGGFGSDTSTRVRPVAMDIVVSGARLK